MSTPQSTLLAARNAALYYSKRQQARDNMLTPLSEVEAFREGYEEGYEEGRGDAIGFAEWISMNNYEGSRYGFWYDGEDQIASGTDELYDLYLTHQNPSCYGSENI